jgi:hypothetical protein
VLLDQQNRMHPAIGELVSRVFYSDRVRTGPAAPRRGTGLPAFPSPVTWVDTRSLRGNVESRAGGTSLFNVAEARLVTSITRNIASHAPPNLTIGVITAYAEQRDLLRRLMGPHDWPPERQLEIDTVDAFEGREKDIIVLSLVRANRRRDIGFLRLEQRLNVAVSRSRRLIVIVGDTSTLRQGYFNQLVSTAHQVGQIVPAPKLIGMFLSRGRRRHERDDRRREDVAEGEGVSVTRSTGVEEGEALAVTAEAGVAPTTVADGHAATGSRRRRRRAWERRRERLRALHEQTGEASEAEPSEGVSEGEIEAEPAIEPIVRTRRPRRRRPEPEAAPQQPEVEEVRVEAEVLDLAIEAPAPEPVRRRRRRVVEEPVEAALEPAVEPAEAAVEAEAPVEPTPLKKTRSRRAAAATANGASLEPVPEPPVEAPAPPKRTRARRTAAVTPNGASSEPIPMSSAQVPAAPEPVAPEPVVPEPVPAKRTRTRRASAASMVVAEPPAPPAPETVETPPTPTRTRRPRAVKANSAED